jgi:hypothetical protein
MLPNAAKILVNFFLTYPEELKVVRKELVVNLLDKEVKWR